MNTAGLFFSLLTGWALTWFVVTYEFGRATYVTWRQADGTTRTALQKLWRFHIWYFEKIGEDLISLFKKRPASPAREFNPPYDRGHYLRLFIGMSAFNSGVMGALSSTQDRSHWPIMLQAIILFAVCFSTAAGLGHLYIAWVSHARRWRFYAAFVFMWVPMGAVLYRAVAGW